MSVWLEKIYRVYEEGRACLATRREIDIQIRQSRGMKLRTREDFEKLLDNYIPGTRKEIMRHKKLLGWDD